MQPLDGPLLGSLAAAVVAGRRLHIGVAHQLLHRHDVGARVEEVTGERAPQVFRAFVSLRVPELAAMKAELSFFYQDQNHR